MIEERHRCTVYFSGVRSEDFKVLTAWHMDELAIFVFAKLHVGVGLLPSSSASYLVYMYVSKIDLKYLWSPHYELHTDVMKDEENIVLCTNCTCTYAYSLHTCTYSYASVGIQNAVLAKKDSK